MPLASLGTGWGQKLINTTLPYQFKPMYLAALIWLLAANAAIASAERFFEETAAPRGAHPRSQLFHLALVQGWLPMGIWLAGITLYNVMAYLTKLRSIEYLSLPGLVVISGGLEIWFFTLGLMLWILASRTAINRPLLSVLWLLLPPALAEVVGTAFWYLPRFEDVLEQLRLQPQYFEYYGPVLLSATVLFTLAWGLVTRHQRWLNVGMSGLAVLYGLSIFYAHQLLLVAVACSGLLGQTLLAGFGITTQFPPLWSLYGPSYVTGGTGILDANTFMYSVL